MVNDVQEEEDASMKTKKPLNGSFNMQRQSKIMESVIEAPIENSDSNEDSSELMRDQNIEDVSKVTQKSESVQK